MAKVVTMTVKILGKDYQVSCAEDEVDDLTASARYLHRKMEEIKDGGRVVGLDRIAVMAALNISHELLSSRNQADTIEGDISGRLNALSHRLDLALAEHKQLEL